MKFDKFELDSEEYSLEHLTDSAEDLSLISNFKASNNAYGLESYLKEWSLIDEEKSSNRTYLVKDKSTNELVGYFSLRTGLMTLKSENPENENSFETMPAVELSNFAVNMDYKYKHPESTRHGLFIFRNFIRPLVKEIKKYIGINMLCIYALPEDKLIDHYGTMGFSRLPADKEKFVHFHVKPEYDDGCIFMFQTI